MFYIFQILGQEVCPLQCIRGLERGKHRGKVEQKKSKQKRRRRRRRRRRRLVPTTSLQEAKKRTFKDIGISKSPCKSTNESEVGVKQKAGGDRRGTEFPVLTKY